MKKHLSIFAICCILFCSLSIPVYAMGNAVISQSESVITSWKVVSHITSLANGDEIVETSPVIHSISKGSTIVSKDYYYRDSSGTVLWKATLEGTFSFNGVSASCTAASCTTTSYSSAWSEQSTTAYPSGASAIGSATMVRKFLFIVVDTVSVNISMVCNKDGNIS